MHRNRIAVLIALVVAALGLLVAPAGAAPPGVPSYVALGDSYTSGTYTPFSLAVQPECAQSQTNYPKLVAATRHLTYADVSCGGATVADFTGKQYGIVPAQFDALDTGTDIVSVGIGGNDNNTFITAVLGCAALDAFNVFDIGAPCAAAFGNSFASSISADGANIAAALQQIHTRSPGAAVFVVGYPDILPQHGRCYPTLPLSTGDISYLNGVERDLDTMLATAAASAGATYVDTFTPSIGHDACQAVGTRWIEPVIPNDLQAPVHPNAAGEAADARAVEAAFTAAGV
jgi:lysophospholipase L1-like esterase